MLGRRVVSLVALWLVFGIGAAAAQSMARRVGRLLDRPPFDRTIWGVIVTDTTGRVLFQHNADDLFVPASNTKLVVAATASALLPPDFHTTTKVFGTDGLDDGILHGDLVVYGGGDPTFSARCYGLDTLTAGVCDSIWTRMDMLADSLVARGLKAVEGKLVGDGSYFLPELVHPAWETYDLNWWYAAPVSGLGFNDNSVDFAWAPGPRVGAPAVVTFQPNLGNFLFENRTHTVEAGNRSTIDFFRAPGTMHIWAEGTAALDHPPDTAYFALPNPNLYFAQALRAALAARGIAVEGPTVATTDSMLYRDARQSPALATLDSRPLSDMLFPILDSSQNWFAEMLLKLLGKTQRDTGSWAAGLAVERRFLMDSVGVDSTAFHLVDGSGLATSNLIAPRTFVQILRYMRNNPNNAAFMRGLPRAGMPGTLEDRFVGTPLDGRVIAKTGSISHVNSLSGYLKKPNGRTLIFSVIANNHALSYAAMLHEIDSVVVAMGR